MRRTRPPLTRTYALIISDVVLTAQDPTNRGRAATSVSVGVTGSLIVRPKGTSGASDQTLRMVAGKTLRIEISRILAGSTAQRVLVGWDNAATIEVGESAGVFDATFDATFE